MTRHPIDYARKENVFVAGRMSSERHEVVAQALDAEQSVGRCLGLIFLLDAKADRILWAHRCPPGNSRALKPALESLDAHERWKLEAALRKAHQWHARQDRARRAARTLGLRHPEGGE